MRKIDLLFSEYGKSHRNITNQWIHYFCVPLIFWSILGFISLIPSPHLWIHYFGYISLVSIAALVLVLVYYYRLNWKIASISIFFLLLMEHFVYFIHHYFDKKAIWIFLIVFVITWIFQFVGHKIEGKKPSFLKDIQFLLIGPIWLLKKLLPFTI
jgi:uncharacterized membrane protein YGL010W